MVPTATSNEEPRFQISKKFVVSSLAIVGVIVLAFLRADTTAYITLGAVASAYLGGQSYVDGRKK